MIVKVKYDNFQQVTRSKTLSQTIKNYEQLYSICVALIKKTEAGKRKVRLIGVGVSSFIHKGIDQRQQLEFNFDL